MRPGATRTGLNRTCSLLAPQACYPKKDGCPLQCSSDQIYCYSYTYTSSGLPALFAVNRESKGV